VLLGQYYADNSMAEERVQRRLSAAIPGQIDRAAVAQIRERPPANLTAYDYELRGRWAFLHLADGLSVALDWFKRAVAADPGYALAHAGLGMTYVFGILSLGLPPEEARGLGIQHARQAVMLDEGNCKVNACAAFTYHIAGEHKLTRKHAERAVALNPNDPFALFTIGCALSYTGEPEKAVEWIMRSARLDPFALDDQRLDELCDCYYMLHDYAKLLEFERRFRMALPIFTLCWLRRLPRLDGTRKPAPQCVNTTE
jgi:tetratricopeptide (TPR) repeat protein